MDRRHFHVSPSAVLAAFGTREHLDDLVADLLGVRIEVEQDAGGDTFVLPHKAEEDVLCTDVVMTERERLTECELKDLLARAE